MNATVGIDMQIQKEPDAPLTGPLTRGQALSTFLIAFGIFLVVRGYKAREFESAQRLPAA